MEIGTGFAANVSSEVAKGIFQEAKQYIRYVWNYKKKVEQFEQKLATLIAKRTSVQAEVDAAKRDVQTIRDDVQLWCKKVDEKIDQQLKTVEVLKFKAKNKCFIGLCPSIHSRYQLSTGAEEVADSFKDLINQEAQLTRPVGLLDVPEEDIEDGAAKDFEAFESRQEVFNVIMDALKDTTVGIIGAYGMPGVGKTTLVRQVQRQAKKDQLFDAVIMVEVKQTPIVQTIQDYIAESLGLKLEEKSGNVRASRLRQRLKQDQEKKILIILDDLWAKLDLENDLGIPVGDKGCQILLTSRSKDVLQKEMSAQKTFQICVLDKEEPWCLLKKIAGDNIDSPDLQPIAKQVANECAGLPLAIKTVGMTLKGEPSYVWEDALKKLQSPSTTKLDKTLDMVYKAIELSYDRLEEEHKQTFLLCSLVGHHAYIQELLKYSMGLGLFSGVTTVKDTRNRLLTRLRDLKASCLLQDSHSNDRVDIHDVICDAGLWIASVRDKNVFALKHGNVLQGWPEGKRMEELNMIDLYKASIRNSKLPEGLHCPELTLFHMHSKDPNVEIPSNFFEEMKKLKVLDLTRMHFSSLPSSIRALTNLRTLCLDGCKLEDIALIGELTNLEILSLWVSDIEKLPEEIGQLTNLKLLDLSGCAELKKIPAGLLSKLSSLEELYMGGSFNGWEAERDGTNPSLAELKNLSHLTTLEIHITAAKIIMPNDLWFSENQLKSYKIFIGKSWEHWTGKHEYSKTLRLQLDRSIHHLDQGIKKLLKRAEDLCLDDMKDAGSALDGLRHDMEGLKNLQISNCQNIQSISGDIDEAQFRELKCLTLENLPELISFSRESSTSGSQHKLPLFSEQMVFPCLEKLRLSAIKNVERIWHPQLISSEKLTSLIIEGCGKLKYVLSTSMAKSLVKIKYFDIVDCKFLEKIIFSEEGDITEEEIEFPQLDSLKMKNLENLRGFCSQDHKINFPSLTILEIDHCPKLKGFIEDNRRLTPQAFFDEKVGFPSLQKLSIGSLTNVEMLWHNQLSENSFCKLREMSVQYCKELATVIIPCDMWSTLKRLETLRVLYCGSLEEIFEFPRQGVATELRELLVWSLPKLKQVWSKDPGGSSSAFENLHSVEVWDCWSLQNVFPASVARVLPQLKHLDIDQCGVEEIVSKDIEGSDTAITFMFDQLSILELRQLTKLKCFYPGLHTITCPRLKKLKAWRCNQVRIFGTELNDYADDRQPQESLFLIEQSTSTFAELEEVCLTSEEIAIICKKFPEVCFPEGKVLAVSSYHDENSAIFLISFLEKFNNLEKLEFVGCNFREPFGFGEEMNAGIQLPFKSLKLDNLNHIESIWNDQESRLDHFLPNLETLEVSGCYDLKCLGSSPAPFKNLVTLEVTHCCKMINLVESSTAIQSLEQLKNLKIRSCFKLEKIVGNEGCHESEDRIIFKSLKCLELKDLPNLVCFCRGTNTFEFPLLEQVVVMRCPELKIFCTGVVEAPLLERVLATDEDEDRKGHWDGDLKTTVEQLYTNKVGLNEKISDLELSDLHKSMEFWRDNLQGKLNFRQLLALEVHDCGSLKSIFTISMARSLVQLIKIEVRNCPMMEQIITKEGAEEETVVLPCLMTITLESCSSLTSFFLGSNTLECFSLQGIRIIDCPKMFEFASESPRNQDMETNGRVDAPFFNDKAVLPSLEELQLSPFVKKTIPPSDKLQRLWHDQLPERSCYFLKLETLDIEGCNFLNYVFPFSVAENFVHLEKLHISDCDDVKEVIVMDKFVGEEGRIIKVFPKLQSMQLMGLSKLVRFCYGDSIEFPKLIKLRIKNCPEFKAFVDSNSVIGDDEGQVDPNNRRNNSKVDGQCLFNDKVAFPGLKALRLEGNCGKWKKIWHHKLTPNSFGKLELLILETCEGLSSIFPSSMVDMLQKLNVMLISHCDDLESIIEPSGLPSTESSTIKFVLSRVRWLELESLSKLKSFYPKMHTTEWPALQKLIVTGCTNVKIFALENLNSQLDIPANEQPLFWFSKEAFPCLEKLKTDQDDTKEILELTNYQGVRFIEEGEDSITDYFDKDDEEEKEEEEE